MTSSFAEMSSIPDFVLASLSVVLGRGKLRRREGSHGRSFQAPLEEKGEQGEGGCGRKEASTRRREGETQERLQTRKEKKEECEKLR